MKSLQFCINLIIITIAIVGLAIIIYGEMQVGMWGLGAY